MTPPPRGGWSELFGDALQNIVHRLDLIDFVRFGAVCRSWRSSASAHRHHCDRHLKTLIPWLLLPSSRALFEIDPHVRHFYCLNDQSTYRIRLPPLAGADRCIGSFGGLLISVDSAADLHVTNPLTGAHSLLPPTSTLPDIAAAPTMWDPQYLRNNYFCKAVIGTAHDAAAASVAIVCSLRELLAYASLGDAAWTALHWPSGDCIDDVAFHKGRLHAASKTETLVFDLDSPLDPPASIIDPLEGYAVRSGTKRYLVVSLDGDDLFLVIRKPDSGNLRLAVGGCAVFKLNESGDQWDEVLSLAGVALFLGSNSFFSLPGSSVVTGNCIYFLDDVKNGNRISFFDLRDGRTKRLDVSYPPLQLNWGHPLWFTPCMT